MTRPRGPLFRAGAAAVLVWFASCLVAGCAETPAPAPGSPAEAKGRADERDLFSLLPAGVDSILRIDMTALRRSEFAAPILSSLGPGGDARARGFAVVDDVDTWVIARLGTPGGERATIEIVQGRFDEAAVHAAFTSRFPNAKRTEFGRLPGATEARAALGFVSPRTLVYGPAWAVRAVAAVVDGRAPSARSEPWVTNVGATLEKAARRRALLGRAATRDRRARVAADGSAPAPPPAGVELRLRASPNTHAELAELFDGPVPIEELGIRLDLHAGAEGLLMATAESPEAAEGLAARLKEALVELGERPSVTALGLAGVVRRADVAAKDVRVALTVSVSDAERARLAARLADFGRALSEKRGLPSLEP